MEELNKCKKSFYVGSILPDCVPSFLTRKHNIEETLDLLKTEISKVTDKYDVTKGINTYFCRHLGMIIHYVADYFTFPHNSIYPGTMMEHCYYEKELKFAFRKYVKSEQAKRNRLLESAYNTPEEIVGFVKSMHDEYLKAIKRISVDCHYIVELCFRVVDAILHYFENSRRVQVVVM